MKEKVALITGGTKRIGRAIALSLASDKYSHRGLLPKEPVRGFGYRAGDPTARSPRHGSPV